MSVRLLDKTRKIGKLLRNAGSSRIGIGELCAIISEELLSNVYVVDKTGMTLFSAGSYAGKSFERTVRMIPGDEVERDFLGNLHRIFSTKENVPLYALGYEEGPSNVIGIVSPVDIAGERLGTMLFFRKNDPYDIDDVILAEYAAMLTAIELARTAEEKEEEHKKDLAAVKAALGSLSGSEQRAAAAVFRELDGAGGSLITLHVAKKYDITRSIIINALRKLESAGVVDIRSAGAKGTKIKVKNELIFGEVLKYSADE